MSQWYLCVVGGLGSIMLAFAGVAMTAAPEHGSLSYMALYQALRPALEARKFDRLLAITNVQSKLAGVSPSAIQLEIHSRSGVRKLRIDAHGNFELPVNDDLMAENPTVVSNQPKGSLTLSVTMTLKPFHTLRVPYREIALGLAQARQALGIASENGNAMISGLEVRFQSGRVATVILRGASEQLLMTDAAGTVVIRDSSEWRHEDAEVEFSEQPLILLPYLAASGVSR